MNKILFIVVAILPFYASDAIAQQAKTVSNYVVIDCSTMPANALRSVAYEPTHNELSPVNRVPVKFAVSKTDVNSSGSAGSELMDWATATAACAAYKGSDSEAGKWRLPVQRELMLCWTMRKSLEKQPDFSPWPNNNRYWCSTETRGAATGCWVVYFLNNGTTTKTTKTYYGYYVRCVRELD